MGILIYPNVELLDFAGPYEVLSLASIHDEEDEIVYPFNLFMISQNNNILKTRAGLKVLVDYKTKDHPRIDILLIPGGFGIRNAIENLELIDWVKDTAHKAELITSVCTGSFLLAKAGALNGKKVTTHISSLQTVQKKFPDVEVITDKHVVEDGDIITSAGISAGIDLGFRIVERCFGSDLVKTIARRMEYSLNPENKRKI